MSNVVNLAEYRKNKTWVKMRVIPQVENLIFKVNTLAGGVDGVTYFQMLGGKLKAKNVFFHVVPRDKIYDYDTAIVQNIVEATAEVHWVSKPADQFDSVLKCFFKPFLNFFKWLRGY